MKKYKYIMSITVMGMFIVLSSACKKILEIPPNATGQLVTSQVFADSASAVSGVVGIYTGQFSGSNGPFSLFMSLYPSLSSDDLVFSSGTDPFYADNLLAGNPSMPSGTSGLIWEGFYKSNLIYQTNAAIEGIEASNSLSPSLKNQLIGECEVIRALSYFYLVNLYGPIPLALSTNYAVNNKLPRATVEAVYAQITADLIDAGNRLPVAYPSAQRGRPNKYTAMALLSRVYLYNQQWSLAKTTADAIINSGNYTIESLDNVFVVGNQEAIWQAAPIIVSLAASTGEGNTFVPYANSIIPQYSLNSNLLQAFESGDQRVVHWLGVNNVSNVSYYYPDKYKNTYNIAVNGRIEGEVIFRLAEQYLIRAEAKIQLGDLAGGAQDIDVIRQRAGLPNTTAVSKEDLLNAVAHERQTEFFCEWGHRWLDLKRTGTLNTVMQKEKAGIWPVDGHSALYPVPYDQLHLNPGWAQNPGY